MSRKESLIIATVDVIDELGIMGLSTREIARREGVSEATIFRHYKSKNELLIAVLDYFLKFDADVFQGSVLKELTPTETIFDFIESLIDYYENYPAITSIMQMLDVLRFEPGLEGKVQEIMDHRNQCVKQLVEAAIWSGELRSEICAVGVTDLICGLFQEICLEWRISNRQFSLRERMLTTLTMFLK